MNVSILPDVGQDNAALITIAVAAIVVLGVTLVLRFFLNSRIALLIAIVAGIVIAAPHLSGVLSVLANLLIVMAVVGGGATVALMYLMARYPELREVVRDVIALLPKRQTAVGQPPRADMIIDQPDNVTRAVTRRRVVRRPNDTKGWW